MTFTKLSSGRQVFLCAFRCIIRSWYSNAIGGCGTWELGLILILLLQVEKPLAIISTKRGKGPQIIFGTYTLELCP
jgi:hypothetical protein